MSLHQSATRWPYFAIILLISFFFITSTVKADIDDTSPEQEREQVSEEKTGSRESASPAADKSNSGGGGGKDDNNDSWDSGGPDGWGDDGWEKETISSGGSGGPDGWGDDGWEKIDETEQEFERTVENEAKAQTQERSSAIAQMTNSAMDWLGQTMNTVASVARDLVTDPVSTIARTWSGSNNTETYSDLGGIDLSNIPEATVVPRNQDSSAIPSNTSQPSEVTDESSGSSPEPEAATPITEEDLQMTVTVSIPVLDENGFISSEVIVESDGTENIHIPAEVADIAVVDISYDCSETCDSALPRNNLSGAGQTSGSFQVNAPTTGSTIIGYTATDENGNQAARYIDVSIDGTPQPPLSQRASIQERHDTHTVTAQTEATSPSEQPEVVTPPPVSTGDPWAEYASYEAGEYGDGTAGNPEVRDSVNIEDLPDDISSHYVENIMEADPYVTASELIDGWNQLPQVARDVYNRRDTTTPVNPAPNNSQPQTIEADALTQDHIGDMDPNLVEVSPTRQLADGTQITQTQTYNSRWDITPDVYYEIVHPDGTRELLEVNQSGVFGVGAGHEALGINNSLDTVNNGDDAYDVIASADTELIGTEISGGLTETTSFNDPWAGTGQAGEYGDGTAGNPNSQDTIESEPPSVMDSPDRLGTPPHAPDGVTAFNQGTEGVTSQTPGALQQPEVPGTVPNVDTAPADVQLSLSDISPRAYNYSHYSREGTLDSVTIDTPNGQSVITVGETVPGTDFVLQSNGEFMPSESGAEQTETTPSPDPGLIASIGNSVTAAAETVVNFGRNTIDTVTSIFSFAPETAVNTPPLPGAPNVPDLDTVPTVDESTGNPVTNPVISSGLNLDNDTVPQEPIARETSGLIADMAESIDQARTTLAEAETTDTEAQLEAERLLAEAENNFNQYVDNVRENGVPSYEEAAEITAVTRANAEVAQEVARGELSGDNITNSRPPEAIVSALLSDGRMGTADRRAIIEAWRNGEIVFSEFVIDNTLPLSDGTHYTGALTMEIDTNGDGIDERVPVNFSPDELLEVATIAREVYGIDASLPRVMQDPATGEYYGPGIEIRQAGNGTAMSTGRPTEWNTALADIDTCSEGVCGLERKFYVDVRTDAEIAANAPPEFRLYGGSRTPGADVYWQNTPSGAHDFGTTFDPNRTYHTDYSQSPGLVISGQGLSPSPETLVAQRTNEIASAEYGLQPGQTSRPGGNIGSEIAVSPRPTQNPNSPTDSPTEPSGSLYADNSSPDTSPLPTQRPVSGEPEVPETVVTMSSMSPNNLVPEFVRTATNVVTGLFIDTEPTNPEDVTTYNYDLRDYNSISTPEVSEAVLATSNAYGNALTVTEAARQQVEQATNEEDRALAEAALETAEEATAEARELAINTYSNQWIESSVPTFSETEYDPNAQPAINRANTLESEARAAADVVNIVTTRNSGELDIPMPQNESCGNMSCEEWLVRIVHAEGCGNGGTAECSAIAEAARNRVIADGLTWEEALRWSSEYHGYYQGDPGNRERFASVQPGSVAWERAQEAVDAALEGSNVCNGCTDNWANLPEDHPWYFNEDRRRANNYRTGQVIGNQIFYNKTYRPDVSISDHIIQTSSLNEQDVSEMIAMRTQEYAAMTPTERANLPVISTSADTVVTMSSMNHSLAPDTSLVPERRPGIVGAVTDAVTETVSSVSEAVTNVYDDAIMRVQRGLGLTNDTNQPVSEVRSPDQFQYDSTETGNQTETSRNVTGSGMNPSNVYGGSANEENGVSDVEQFVSVQAVAFNPESGVVTLAAVGSNGENRAIEAGLGDEFAIGNGETFVIEEIGSDRVSVTVSTSNGTEPVELGEGDTIVADGQSGIPETTNPTEPEATEPPVSDNGIAVTSISQDFEVTYENTDTNGESIPETGETINLGDNMRTPDGTELTIVEIDPEAGVVIATRPDGEEVTMHVTDNELVTRDTAPSTIALPTRNTAGTAGNQTGAPAEPATQPAPERQPTTVVGRVVNGALNTVTDVISGVGSFLGNLFSGNGGEYTGSVHTDDGDNDNNNYQNTLLPKLIGFEVLVTNFNKVTVSDWSNNDVEIYSGENIHFRWKADTLFKSCEASIKPVSKADMSGLSRNTYDEKIDLIEANDTYTITCIGNNGQKVTDGIKVSINGSNPIIDDLKKTTLETNSNKTDVSSVDNQKPNFQQKEPTLLATNTEVSQERSIKKTPDVNGNKVNVYEIQTKTETGATEVATYIAPPTSADNNAPADNTSTDYYQTILEKLLKDEAFRKQATNPSQTLNPEAGINNSPNTYTINDVASVTYTPESGSVSDQNGDLKYNIKLKDGKTIETTMPEVVELQAASWLLEDSGFQGDALELMNLAEYKEQPEKSSVLDKFWSFLRNLFSEKDNPDVAPETYTELPTNN